MTNPPQYPSYPGENPDEGGPSYPVHPGTPPSQHQAGPEVPQPTTISRAVRLMQLGAAISLVGFIYVLITLEDLKDEVRLQTIENDPTVDQSTLDATVAVAVAFFIVFGVLGVALWLWMAWKNGQGRRWARIVATVLGVINVLSVLYTVSLDGATTLTIVLSLVNLVLAVVILILLWQKPSSDYYAYKSQPKLI